MKKRVFFQMSILLCILLILFLAIMLAAVYVMVYFFLYKLHTVTAFDIIVLVASFGGFIYIGYTFVRMVRNRIVLNATEIFVPEHWGKKDNKIQYETHIPYISIKNIFIILSDKNSLNKAVKWVFTPMPYIVIDCINNEQKAVNVFYYSKKQVVKIIDETILRAREAGNDLQINSGIEILSEFLNMQK